MGSYPLYLRPARRPAWLRVKRLRGKRGIKDDTAEGWLKDRYAEYGKVNTFFR